MPGQRHRKQTTTKQVEYADGKETFYGVVTKKLGGTHVLVLCSDGKERRCLITNKFRRRIWLDKGSVILWCHRPDVSGETIDIKERYLPDIVKQLRQNGSLAFADSIGDEMFADHAETEVKVHKNILKQPSRDLPPAYSDEEYDNDSEQGDHDPDLDPDLDLDPDSDHDLDHDHDEVKHNVSEESGSGSGSDSGSGSKSGSESESGSESDTDEKEWRSGDKKKRGHMVDSRKRKPAKAFKKNRQGKQF